MQWLSPCGDQPFLGLRSGHSCQIVFIGGGKHDQKDVKEAQEKAQERRRDELFFFVGVSLHVGNGSLLKISLMLCFIHTT